MIPEKMLEFLVLGEILQKDNNYLSLIEYEILEDKYRKIRSEFLNEQLPLTKTKNPVKD